MLINSDSPVAAADPPEELPSADSPTSCFADCFPLIFYLSSCFISRHIQPLKGGIKRTFQPKSTPNRPFISPSNHRRIHYLPFQPKQDKLRPNDFSRPKAICASLSRRSQQENRYLVFSRYFIQDKWKPRGRTSNQRRRRSIESKAKASSRKTPSTQAWSCTTLRLLTTRPLAQSQQCDTK